GLVAKKTLHGPVKTDDLIMVGSVHTDTLFNTKVNKIVGNAKKQLSNYMNIRQVLTITLTNTRTSKLINSNMIIRYLPLTTNQKNYSLIFSLLQHLYMLASGDIDGRSRTYRCWKQDIYAVEVGYICATNRSYREGK
ncbi:hypothetical protein, partial [uncultured Bacteroides sp.]